SVCTLEQLLPCARLKLPDAPVKSYIAEVRIAVGNRSFHCAQCQSRRPAPRSAYSKRNCGARAFETSFRTRLDSSRCCGLLFKVSNAEYRRTGRSRSPG